ncbi:unnamed protein product [Anisakis simplex]|uniref:Uncharacterized protein n=1 Tax=Anisakis simplex TaxID=6269 RepID=A0A0M3KEW6_ANISI|nr:unnamed protein product [Anisakis simplex]
MKDVRRSYVMSNGELLKDVSKNDWRMRGRRGNGKRKRGKKRKDVKWNGGKQSEENVSDRWKRNSNVRSWLKSNGPLKKGSDWIILESVDGGE